MASLTSGKPRKMSAAGMWESMKVFGNQMADGAKKAADSTQRAANRTKIKADILLLQNKMKKEKQKFGIKVYDSLVRGHESEWKPILAETKVLIDGIAMNIENKKIELAELADGNSKGSLAGKSTASDATSESVTNEVASGNSFEM
eukprot:g3844.t1